MEEIIPYEETGLGKPGLEEGKSHEVENYYYGGAGSALMESESNSIIFPIENNEKFKEVDWKILIDAKMYYQKSLMKIHKMKFKKF